MKEESELLIDALCVQVGYSKPDHFKSIVNEWATVLSTLSLPINGHVLELGPGMSPKLIFALHELDFRGVLDIVDLNERALQAQNYVASRLRPQFMFRGFRVNLYDFDLSYYHLVAGNHFIDDLIAEDFSTNQGVDYKPLFADPVGQENFWKVVEEDRVALRESTTRFHNKLVGVRKGGWVVLNNYRANFDSRYALGLRTTLGDRLLKDLSLLMGGDGFVTHQRIDECSEGSWLVMQKRV